MMMTMLIAVPVDLFRSSRDSIHSNQSYQDKAAMITLYSYLFALGYMARDPHNNYLLVATVSGDHASRNGGLGRNKP